MSFQNQIIVVSILLRLDFQRLMLAQPETVDNKCQYDQFIVSGGNPIPAICGTNDGLHGNITYTGVGRIRLEALFSPGAMYVQ